MKFFVQKMRRKKERLWRRHKTDEARNAFKDARNHENRLIIKRKCEYYRRKTAEAGKDINKLYKILDNLTDNKKKNKLPEGFSDIELSF